MNRNLILGWTLLMALFLGWTYYKGEQAKHLRAQHAGQMLADSLSRAAASATP